MRKNYFIDIKIVDLLFDNYDIVDNYVKSKQDKAEKFYKESFLSLGDSYE